MALKTKPYKLNLGIPLYGRSWKLIDDFNTGLGSSANGPAESEIGTSGIMPYLEVINIYKLPTPSLTPPNSQICNNIRNNNWTHTSAQEPCLRGCRKMQLPYAYGRERWTSYDDVASASAKARYVVSRGIGGVFFWELSYDDARNVCENGKYPIISAVNKVLFKKIRFRERSIVRKKEMP